MLLFLQNMVLLGSTYHQVRDQRDDMSLGIIRTHVSRVAPGLGPLKDTLPFELQRLGFLMYLKYIAFSI